MKNLRSDIEEKYKIALKNNDKAGIRTLRLIKSAIKDKDIALRSEDNKDELLDSGIQKLLKNLVKQSFSFFLTCVRFLTLLYYIL